MPEENNVKEEGLIFGSVFLRFQFIVVERTAYIVSARNGVGGMNE
jgi:hypothetical protein